MANKLAEMEMSLSTYRRQRRNGKSTARSLSKGSHRRSRAFQAVDYSVPGPFSVIAQEKTMGCWAAALTMLTNWKEQMSRPVESVLGDVGSRWLQMYHNNTGLFPRDEAALIRDAGLSAQRDISMSVQGWVDLLEQHGPIWITVDMAPGRRGGDACQDCNGYSWGWQS